MALFLLLVLLFGVSSEGDTFHEDDVIVHLNNGDLRGEKMVGEKGNEFYAFRGIPFAEPPVGKLRFQPPVPKGPWKGVLNATRDGPPCCQTDLFTLSYLGVEDCLYLNVYTPKLPGKGNDKKMDVVYNIHGGGFLAMMGNSKLFGPRRFPLNNAILVSLTYRVSAMGFLSTNDSSSRGNYGLLDQVEGLRWVKNNIDRFGGDPKRVTIYGESAGGASVIYHMLSPLSAGLFQRAIAMSGSAVCHWALQKDPVYWSTKLGNDIGCPTKSTESLVECLRNKDAQEVTEKAMAQIQGLQYLTIVPTLDNYFIHDLPIKLIKGKKYQTDVPLILGMTKDEGECLYLGLNSSSGFTPDETASEVIKEFVDARTGMESKVQLIKDRYFPNATSYSQQDLKQRIPQAVTDGMFHKCIYLTAKRMSESGSKVYLLQYDYKGPFSAAQFLKKPPGDYGVCHLDDLAMFFDGAFHVERWDETSEKVKGHFQKLFTNFFKHGVPTFSEDKDLCEWPESKSNALKVYHLNTECSVESYNEANDTLYKFWVDDVNQLDL